MSAHNSNRSATQSLQSSTESPIESADDSSGTLNEPIDTQVLKQKVEVSWEFPVAFTRKLFDLGNPVLLQTICRLESDKKHRLIIFIDAGVVEANNRIQASIIDYCEHNHRQLDLVCEPVVMPGGESIKKDWLSVEQIQSAVHEHNIDRHSYVIAIGGGALLDAVGLVAATSHRGIRHIRIPSTVLAQNDSGVGVKNGVNLFGQKNYLGTFSPPFAVLNDYDLIETLPAREKTSGIAEAVKVALIRDKKFFLWLEQHTEDLQSHEADAMKYMIKRCAQLHMHQIGHGGDPFETGSARPLDFGHWLAHKLEIMTEHRLRHGEAVAIGIALDTRYSVLAGLLAPGEDERVCSLLEQLGFKLWHTALSLRNVKRELEILAGLEDFREHLGGELTITLLQSVGTGIEVHSMERDRVEQSLEWLQARQGR